MVSVTAVYVLEREDTVGWLLSWVGKGGVGRPLVQLLGSGGLVEALCLSDGFNDCTDWRCNLE